MKDLNGVFFILPMQKMVVIQHWPYPQRSSSIYTKVKDSTNAKPARKIAPVTVLMKNSLIGVMLSANVFLIEKLSG